MTGKIKLFFLISATALIIPSIAFSAAMPEFGPDGLKGLTKEQIVEINKGKVVFSTADKPDGGDTKSALITAAIVFNKPINDVMDILYKTENQANYISECKESKVIKKGQTQDNIEFAVKALFTIRYRVIHNFDRPNAYYHWDLDPAYKNGLDDLRGFWRFYPYGNNQTLARYGSNVSLKGVPDFIANMFKKSGVNKALDATKKYVESDGKYHK